MRFKDIKKVIREKDNTIKRQQRAIDDLKQYQEHRYNFNQIDIIVRPSREEYLHPFEFDVDLRVGSPLEKNFCYRRRMDLTTLDLIPDKERFIKDMAELMMREILAAAGKA